MKSILGTTLILAVLVFVVFLIIRDMIRKKKKGKSAICGCDCKHCGGPCCK